MALGAVEAARAAGKDKLIVIGVDGNTNAVKSILAGRLNASVAQLPYLVGMQAVENDKKVLAGEKVAEFTYVPTLVLTKDGAGGEEGADAAIREVGGAAAPPVGSRRDPSPSGGRRPRRTPSQRAADVR